MHPPKGAPIKESAGWPTQADVDQDSLRPRLGCLRVDQHPTIVNTMSVIASTPEVRSKRGPLIRIVSILGLVLIVAILGAAAWLYSIARSALPQLDGSV